MRARSLILYCLTGLSSLALATSSAAQTPPPLVETMEVRVVNVDVVVTDRQGRRVTGLTQDDFEVFERRRRQKITNFSEIGNEPPPTLADATAVTPVSAAAVARRNSILFFIDGSSLDPRRRHLVFEELRRFASSSMGPGDRAMVAVWNRSFRIVQTFTDSPQLIQQALTAAESESGAIQLQAARRTARERIQEELRTALAENDPTLVVSAYRRAEEHARVYTEEVYAQVRALLSSVSTSLTTFAGTEDRKAFVYVGDFLPTETGAELMQFLDDVFRDHLRGLEHSITSQLTTVSMENWINGVVRAANAGGVTMYMISADGLRQLADASLAEPPSPVIEAILEMDTRRSFVRTSQETGGLAFMDGDPRAALRQIEDDFRAYYSIGFRPASGSSRANRAISVRVKKSGLTVRSRRGYGLRSVTDEMEERVLANVYQDEAPGELVVRTAAQRPVPGSRGQVRIPVRVFVKGDKITLIRQGGTLAGEVVVFVCAGTARSGASKVLRHTQRLRIPPADEQRFREGHLTFSFELVSKAGADNVVSAGVLDAVSGSYGTARASVAGKSTSTLSGK